jgi:hypothetical protein
MMFPKADFTKMSFFTLLPLTNMVQTALLSLCVVVSTFLCTQESNAQSALVHNRLRQVLNGNVAEVRKELPELISEFPDDPGVLFLKGILTEDATTALPIFEQITREYPQSEWADDAQWRVVQYYALKRDTSRAQRELNTYKRNYPMSEFLIHAVDIVKVTVGLQQIGTGKTPTSSATASTAIPVAKVQSNEQLTKDTSTKPSVTESEKTKLKEVSKKTTTPIADKANTGSTKQETSIAKPVITPTIIKPQVKILDLPSPTTTEAKVQDSKSTLVNSGRVVSGSTAPNAQPQKPQSSTISVVENPAVDKKYGLQIGVFSTRDVAESEAKKYRDQRLRVDLIDKGEGKYAVVIGNYSSKESATNSMTIVQAQCQCSPYLIEK